MATISDIIAQLRGQTVTKLSERNDLADELGQILASAGAVPADQTIAARARSAKARKGSLDAELDLIEAQLTQLEAEQARDVVADRLAAEFHPTGAIRTTTSEASMTTIVRVGAEAHTYQRGAPTSFLHDLYAAQVRHDPDATARLHRHGGEMTVDGRISERALTSGGVSAFVPPAYLQAEWAELVRAGRPTANLARSLPLPPTGMTVNVPKLSTGTSTAVQATENVAVSETNADDTQLAPPVITIAGQQTLSRQLLERSDPGMDELILGDLASAYAAALDVQVVNGATSMIGVLNTAGINTITYADATPTVPEIFAKCADALQRITGGRFAAPSGWVMHPRRWSWFLAALDTSNRPLVVPGPIAWNAAGVGSGAMSGYEGVVGQLLGVNVYLDANIPINLGGATNEDRIVLAKWDDSILLEENGGIPHLLQFEAPLAASLGVLLVAYGFAAFTAARQPLGISVISGSGLATPTW